MKKFMMMLMISISFLTPGIASVHAEESSDMIVTKAIPSTFTVEIPKSIDLGAANSKVFVVSAKGNIDSYETLVVTAANANMKRTGDSTYTKYAQIELQDAQWKGNELNSKSNSVQGTATFNESRAGSYTGTALFEVILYDGPVIA